MVDPRPKADPPDPPASGRPERESTGRRLALDSATVVFSILLAFAINAWWAGRQAREHERVLLAGILSDFRETRSDLVARLEMARRMAANGSDLRDRLAASPEGAAVEVPDSLVIAVIGSPTYQPATNALDAALASGEIGRIRSAEIQEEISRWRLILADTFESERDVRTVTNDRIVPALAVDVELGPLFDRAVDWAFARYDPPGTSRLRASRELEASLGVRRFYQQFAVSGFEDLLDSLDRSVGLLEAELEE